ncbi:MAG: AAA family ATPase [Candidatus Dadabacteria bacterium]|nr:AAA family ATPase [Candidatus Dadabacteria bacterium]
MPYKTVHDLFEVWVKRCLEKDNSLLFDEPGLWNEENLNIAVNCMLGDRRTDKSNFKIKLESQFGAYDKNHKIWLLLCELLALHYCPDSKMGNKNCFKLTIEKERSDYELLEEKIQQIIKTEGVADIGPQSYRPKQNFSIGYYASFALKYKKDAKMRKTVRSLRNGDPLWKEAEEMFDRTNIIESKFVIDKRKTPHVLIVLNMFCHKYHCRMFSGEHRGHIVSTFSDYLHGDEKTENEKIYSISEAMKKEDSSLPIHLDMVDFYHPTLRKRWDPSEDNTYQMHQKDNTLHEKIWDPSEDNKYLDTLKQFRQIIFQGPPGTGKTYQAKKIAEKLTGENTQGNKWELIQFHPSYNYEDFVRGIQIQTENGETTYETVDRILVNMAEKASADESSDYVLIIDEINRANVSAVLGELIYALEYRDKPIHITYSVNGNAEIAIPGNLYIIGTMNTADRTIGQIDYAVRRRFAFESFLPDVEVIKKESKADNAVKLFNMVQEMFEGETYLSPDYHKNDVAIGHTYFLANNNDELKNKIQYQVIPILEEYLKDGVLKKEAEEIIKQIEEEFNPQDDPTEEMETEDENLKRERKYFRWKHKANGTTDKNYWEKDLGPRRLPWTIVKDFVKHQNPVNASELKITFPDEIHKDYGVFQILEKHERFLSKEDEYIELASGERIMVCTQWSANPVKNNPKAVSYRSFQEFLKTSQNLGYEIEEV